ncbi:MULTISPECIES: tRNA uracil 4-sulfurtransferase ThiI [Kyrpidia]|uniref:Persulfide ATP pyrophosphatase involved in tRNA modification n=2 Tax=Kyrpidia spormannii TaxID=2055160 RepID=A0ACA8Z8H4_9BACL|nr:MULTISPECIES: tRNA uracil 4-sulfurtransferase ThiI [Kyrpidia]MCL6577168.1 tRNA 4-thiouridine(8) synthase ThiI [Kyrpidia sp.]CAB3391726.1 persulfide ATP pyrophosphatase involved in tRNA modification [Kyrpidia spormannii]CAB3392639.1 persulfide ATP pyrophosphatase involved in tRNA modification [Kyrpidia spormannii]HHY67955.1 tRNA 4-thiouridine(8) synthase ThiI [Alicyclobacillus sp.]
MYRLLLVREGEAALKGKNRSSFERRLLDNITMALRPFTEARVYRSDGRVLVDVGGHPWEEIAQAVSRVFGVVSLSPVRVAGHDLEDIENAAVDLMEQVVKKAEAGGGSANQPLTFKVEARRAFKGYPLTSPDISRRLGGAVLARVPGLRVDVHEPQVELAVEVRPEEVYLFAERIPGPGGLPVGVSGRAMLLLSGGIDSPVAGWMTMKRGVQVEAVHFDSYPFTSERSRRKVEQLADILGPFEGGMTLHVVHFTDVQKAIRMHCPEPFYVTIMRRMMVRIAERIAARRRALALVTGESLGQVASQTLESMVAINEVATLPILRPLVAWDKVEIIRLARSIGTYETSIQPYEDCCTIFTPRNPSTRPRLDQVHRAEEKLDVEALTRDAADRVESATFGRNWSPAGSMDGAY